MAATMAARPTAHQMTWRIRKKYALSWRSLASAVDALHTMTRPRPKRATVTAKSEMSDDSFLANRIHPGCNVSHKGTKDTKTSVLCALCVFVADVDVAVDRHEFFASRSRTMRLKASPRSA